jgi:hypothetical protein
MVQAVLFLCQFMQGVEIAPIVLFSAEREALTAPFE